MTCPKVAGRACGAAVLMPCKIEGIALDAPDLSSGDHRYSANSDLCGVHDDNIFPIWICNWQHKLAFSGHETANALGKTMGPRACGRIGHDTACCQRAGGDGDNDIRGSHTQAEQFFYSLYQRGKTAEFVRYGGESHSLALSPGNVRDVFERTVAWFDRFVRNAKSK